MREATGGRPAAGDAFAALGLPRDAGLSDDDVRAAWRRIAAATHPDRDDGGDPARFGAAAAAYATLRTAYGRGEALADLADGQRDLRKQRGVWGRRGVRGRAVRGSRGGRSGRGRLGVLSLRTVAAVSVSAVAFAVAGWSPASVGILTGALTWLIITGRHDVAPRG